MVWKKQRGISLLRAAISAVGITYIVSLSIVSIYPLMLFGICLYLYSQENQEEKIFVYARGAAMILSLFVAGGKIEFILENNWLSACIRLLFILFGSYYFLVWAVQNIFRLYDVVQPGVNKLSPNKVFLISMAILVICWIPFYLTEYPSILTYDSMRQFQQIMGDIPLADHHPIAHTMWIKMWYNTAYLLGANNNIQAYGFISMVQLILMASVFSLAIRFLYWRTGRLSIAFLGIAFYGLVSYNGIYSVTLWKDVAHGMTAVLMLVLLGYYFETPREDKRKTVYAAAVFVCGCLFCLFRSNAYYAFILWAVGIAIYGIIRKDRRITLAVLLTVVTCIVIKGPVYSGIADGERHWTESLSIPLQQISYCIMKGNTLKEDERELLSQLVDIERIPETYKEGVSDPIKNLFKERDNTEFYTAHRAQYMRLYLKIGMRYPLDYLTAWIKQTYGYWYPDVSNWVYSSGIHENTYDINSSPMVSEQVVNKIRESARNYSSRPLYGSFWCLGTFTWCLIVVTAYAACRKRGELIAIYSLLLCLWATLLVSTPVYAEFRYFYSVAASLPLILFMPLSRGRLSEN